MSTSHVQIPTLPISIELEEVMNEHINKCVTILSDNDKYLPVA